MEASLLFGLCTCLLIAAGIADNCNQNKFEETAYYVGELERPRNLDRVCEILPRAISYVEALWGHCEYDCSKQYKTKEYDRLECTMFNKEYHGPLKRQADPCTIITQLTKCFDYHCPQGKHFPNPIPKDYYPFLGYLDYTSMDKDKLRENRKCTEAPMKQYLERSARNHAKYNVLDCKHCTEIKLNWKYFSDDLSEHPIHRPMCEGSTIQQLVVDIMQLGAKRYIQQCESVTCGPGSATSNVCNSLVTICLLVIARVFTS